MMEHRSKDGIHKKEKGLAGVLGAGMGGVGSFAALYGLGGVGLPAASATSGLAAAGTIAGGMAAATVCDASGHWRGIHSKTEKKQCILFSPGSQNEK